MNSMETSQMPRCWSNWAFASSTSVPETSAGPSRYLASPSELQATVGSSGFTPSPAAARAALSVQSSSVNFFWSAAVAASGVSVAAGASDSAAPEGVGVASFFRAPVTARPWVVAPSEGVAFGSEAVSGSLAFALGVALGFPEPVADGLAEPSGVGAPPATVRTGRKYSWAVVPTCSRACAEFVPLGMLTMMFDAPWV
ncbi:hypothetical protein OKW18_005678 [Streptomyces pratensis]|nr:hypothetical protein [Streptomyces pratensis]